MKIHRWWAAAALFVVVLSGSSVANAALVDRGGGMIYDTDLNITWLADANYAMTSGYDADGIMTWPQAMTWAGNLSYGGYTDWRLPTTLQPDAACQFNDGSGSSGYYCTGSEMGHLFYNELGGTAGNSILSSTDSDVALFTNILSYYWTDTEYALLDSYAWHFAFNYGSQGAGLQKLDNNFLYAWAVRDGDVAAVPVPAAVWLFGSGLLGLIGMARCKAV